MPTTVAVWHAGDDIHLVHCVPMSSAGTMLSGSYKTLHPAGQGVMNRQPRIDPALLREQALKRSQEMLQHTLTSTAAQKTKVSGTWCVTISAHVCGSQHTVTMMVEVPAVPAGLCPTMQICQVHCIITIKTE